MKYRIIPAILSGGAGTRLWPASTDERPKQFHAVHESGTLIQETVRRVRGETDTLSFAPPIVLANVKHADLATQQLEMIGVEPARVVLEPIGRNTAATGALAAAVAREVDPDALVLLLPADHVIGDVAGFHRAIAAAAPFARERVVTFGIAPSRPETGYGYIKRGEPLGAGVYAIDAFKEKPDAAQARVYLDDGGYSWNAGMFFFAPDIMLREFAASADIRDAALAALVGARRDGTRIYLDPGLFAQVRTLPLDIAVMEQTRFGAVVPCDIRWADLGAWDEIWRIAAKDASQNVTQGNVIAAEAHGNFIRSDGLRVALLGLDDLIVVASGDTVAILPKARAQDVKRLLEIAKTAP